MYFLKFIYIFIFYYISIGYLSTVDPVWKSKNSIVLVDRSTSTPTFGKHRMNVGKEHNENVRRHKFSRSKMDLALL